MSPSSPTQMNHSPSPRRVSRVRAKDTFFDPVVGGTSAGAQEQRVVVPEVARRLECARLKEATSRVQARKFNTARDYEDAILRIAPFSDSLRRALPSAVRPVPLPRDVQSALTAFIESILSSTYPYSNGKPQAFKTLPPAIQARYIGLLERLFPLYAFCKSKGPKAHALAREALKELLEQAREKMAILSGKRSSIVSADSSVEISISLEAEDIRFGDYWMHPAGEGFALEEKDTARRSVSMPQVLEEDEGVDGISDRATARPAEQLPQSQAETLEQLKSARANARASLTETVAQLEAARREIGLLQRLSKTSEAVIRTLESKLQALEAEADGWRKADEILNRKYGDLETQLARLRRELTRHDATEAKLLTENQQIKVELKATRSALTASLEEVLTLTSRPSSPEPEDSSPTISRSLSLIEEVSSIMEKSERDTDGSSEEDEEEGETMEYEEEDDVVEEEVGNRTIDEYDFVEPGPSDLNGKRSLLKERILPKLGIKTKSSGYER